MSADTVNRGIRYGVLRRSQFITPFGVGSIVNFPDESLMPACIDLWGNNVGEKIYDDRLQKRLKVSYFKMVPSGEDFYKGIPFYRFPKWLFCPKCRSLKHIKDWNMKNLSGEIPRCNICRLKLVPSRFVVVCERGHIDDFPWIEWVHGSAPCGNPDLKINTGGGSSGLVGITVECKTCNKRKTMAGVFNQDALKQYKCKGFKPWANKTENCDLSPRTLQRGASNVYFPKIVSSIVIPPYSDDLIAEIERTDGFNYLKSQEGLFEEEEDYNDFLKVCKKIAASINRNSEEVTPIVHALLSSKDDGMISQDETDYRFDEYKAFLGNVDEGSIDSKDFRIEINESGDYKIPGIEKVVLVHRLREVRALVAFSRLRPLDRNEFDFEEENQDTQVQGNSVKENKNINWLPALEVRGEGIFLSFKTNEIEQWFRENDEVQKRVSLVNERYKVLAQELNREPRTFTPKFIFLHTLAHLLIRQLSFECGYGSASLRERIYCNENVNQPEMAGILIYTASGDSEGTLGGLVRQAKPQFFNSIVRKAVNQAAWCSSDPLCIESSGQGMNSLNLAACHACVLLPETSCEELNRYLDRGLVIGLPGKPEVGFMSSLVSF